MLCRARLTEGMVEAATSCTEATLSTRFWRLEALRDGKSDCAFEPSTRASLGGCRSLTAFVSPHGVRSDFMPKLYSVGRGCRSGGMGNERS